MWETSRNKLKKCSVTKNCSDHSHFKQNVLDISKFLQILSLQPRISKKNSRSLQQFFLTVGQKTTLVRKYQNHKLIKIRIHKYFLYCEPTPTLRVEQQPFVSSINCDNLAHLWEERLRNTEYGLNSKTFAIYSLASVYIPCLPGCFGLVW